MRQRQNRVSQRVLVHLLVDDVLGLGRGPGRDPTDVHVGEQIIPVDPHEEVVGHHLADVGQVCGQEGFLRH